MNAYQPKTGQPCTCKPSQRDNCPLCEGTGQRIDFAAIREATPRTAHDCLPGQSFIDLSKLRGRYRTADGEAMIGWEVELKENGPEFSASGEHDKGAGQCIDSIAAAYPNDAKVQRIAQVWRRYHLNGMQSGTPEQMAELAKRERPSGAEWYKWACDTLKAAGLYEVILRDGISATGGFPADVATEKEVAEWQAIIARGQGIRHAASGLYVPHKLLCRLPVLEMVHAIGRRGYRFGERWVYVPIPQEVLAEIASWADFGPDDGRSLHECQSEEFLQRNGIACRITLADSKPAPWEPAGHHYRVTLSAKGRRMTFDYWDSAHNAAENKRPTVGAIVSCVSADLCTPTTFEDFCSEYGENEDSRKALQTFRRAARFADRLRAFFTEKEREELEGLRG